MNFLELIPQKRHLVWAGGVSDVTVWGRQVLIPDTTAVIGTVGVDLLHRGLLQVLPRLIRLGHANHSAAAAARLGRR